MVANIVWSCRGFVSQNRSDNVRHDQWLFYCCYLCCSSASFRGVVFFPTIITASFFPLLILAKKESEEKYKHTLLDLSRKLFFCALIISIFITIIAHTAINILYGEAYAESATILIIHIWASLFVFMRAVLSKWLGYRKYVTIFLGYTY